MVYLSVGRVIELPVAYTKTLLKVHEFESLCVAVTDKSCLLSYFAGNGSPLLTSSKYLVVFDIV